MPKKIPDVREKILKSAERLFNHYSYEEVDMRLIAKEAGVSVGTIYYHFTDKAGIFISTFENSLDTWFGNLNGIKNSAVHPAQRLNQYLTFLHQITNDRMEAVRMVFYEGIFSSPADSQCKQIGKLFDKIKNQLVIDIASILKDMMPKDRQMDENLIDRLTISTLGSFLTLNKRFPQEIEENVKYITSALEALINSKGMPLKS